MKAYICDICGAYCGHVRTIHGINQPDYRGKFEHLEGTSADCCPHCYNEIMKKIDQMIRDPHE